MTRDQNSSTTDAIPTELLADIDSARKSLQSALDGLNRTASPADVHAALGRTLSASRKLKRACEVLNKLEG